MILKIASSFVVLIMVVSCVSQPRLGNNLEDRVRSYWLARIRGDWERAYAIEYPTLRKTMSEEVYILRHQNSAARVTKFQIKSIREHNNIAEVSLIIELFLRVPGTVQGLHLKVPVKDRWVMVDGIWYHVPRAQSWRKK